MILWFCTTSCIVLGLMVGAWPVYGRLEALPFFPAEEETIATMQWNLLVSKWSWPAGLQTKESVEHTWIKLLHTQHGPVLCCTNSFPPRRASVSLKRRKLLPAPPPYQQLHHLWGLSLIYKCSEEFSWEHPFCLTAEMMNGFSFMQENPTTARTAKISNPFCRQGLHGAVHLLWKPIQGFTT